MTGLPTNSPLCDLGPCHWVPYRNILLHSGRVLDGIEVWWMFEKRRVDQLPENAIAAEEASLVRECEDFLSGQLAKALILARGRVPDWGVDQLPCPWLRVRAADHGPGGLRRRTLIDL